MKFVFSAYHNPRYRTITEYMEDAMRFEGHACAVFNNRSYILPGRLRSAAPLLGRFDLWLLNRRLLRFVRRQAPDLFVEEGGTRIRRSTIEAIRRSGIRTALWTTDPPTDFGPIAAAAGAYDSIVCSGSEAVDLLEGRGIRAAGLLPYACAPQEHAAVSLTGEEKKKWGADVVFIGSNYPNRRAVLAPLVSYDLALWGSGWDTLPANDPLAARVRGLHVRTEEWVRVYSASKIAVVIHYQDGVTPCRQASPKVFEALACGILVLVDDQKDVFRFFEDGRHLVQWKNAVDLRDKISYYLNQPEERQRIARAGRDEALANHTYRDRVRQLIAFAG